MIHTNMPQNCVAFLLLPELTRYAILWSQKFDLTKRLTMLVHYVRGKTVRFRGMFVWIIVFYF